MPAVLSPSTIASTFVSLDEGGDADIVVRRDRGEFLRRWTFTFVCIALLVAIVPMFVVIWRREPAYFTNGIVITLLILTVAILVLGVLGVYLWSISPAGRRRFDLPFLHLNAEGVTVRVDHTEQTMPWSQITAMRLVGADDRSLAITAAPAVVDADQPAEPEGDEEVSAASLEDSEATYTPPDSSWQPSRDDFDAIASEAGTNDEDLGHDAVASDTTQPGGSVTDATEATDPTNEPHDRGDHWRHTLYGTPYVVQMRGCKPPLSEIRPIVHNLSRGRISIPGVADGVLTRWRRSMLAKRAAAKN